MNSIDRFTRCQRCLRITLLEWNVATKIRNHFFFNRFSSVFRSKMMWEIRPQSKDRHERSLAEKAVDGVLAFSESNYENEYETVITFKQFKSEEYEEYDVGKLSHFWRWNVWIRKQGFAGFIVGAGLGATSGTVSLMGLKPEVRRRNSRCFLLSFRFFSKINSKYVPRSAL